MKTPPIPDAADAQVMLRGAIGQIEFARRYTLELLDATPRQHWFEIPAGYQTNIAWQVGHLTVSQYGLLLFRVRGRQPEDLELIPGKFRKAYGRATVPTADQSKQPSPDELLQRMAEVYDRASRELPGVSSDVLLEPVEMPFAAFPNKLGAILFCPLHEQIHCGHIGMLRRGLGLDPIR
ncbi:DinB superfamily protein [Rubripirellula lacrimiformis]|uniref:DinB superfamily protein n=1 Tax=Rubripirellula lacrimiformis TaxID=1930273 RepID=A0A517NKK8_9BACT|nr:DinB family protein [Rubripirellula lacrimiformis]QDT07656.1 DinB superfamily protein [Rubripirellula lacrimiformis]